MDIVRLKSPANMPFAIALDTSLRHVEGQLQEERYSEKQ